MAAGVSADAFFGVILILAASAILVGAALSNSPLIYIHGATALIHLALGVLLVWFPKVGFLSIALVIGIGFYLQGMLQIAFAMSNSLTRGRSLLGLSGVVGVVVGGAVLYCWPFDSAWEFGGLFGSDLVFVGLAVLSLC
ncbi:MAG: DUF308 domain-containing protein [Parvularculaceae bacterium]